MRSEPFKQSVDDAKPANTQVNNAMRRLGLSTESEPLSTLCICGHPRGAHVGLTACAGTENPEHTKWWSPQERKAEVHYRGSYVHRYLNDCRCDGFGII